MLGFGVCFGFFRGKRGESVDLGFFIAAFEQGRFSKCCICEKYIVVIAMHRKKTPLFTGLNIQVHGVAVLFPDIIVF